ncbi:hypothetical protein DRH14_00100 [Candidatus Shapirobacteria bacterium]|nr:MAG: hypothetical protein DRH14_00100 [Candidatus Shapirobacteria bacterium]
MLKLLIFFFFTFFLLAHPYQQIYAQTPKKWTGRCVATFDNEVATIQGLECLFYNILQIIVFIAGISFFIMFVINGFRYIFSSSDQKQLANIQSALTMSIFGVIGIIGSWLILRLIENITGLNVTQFKIPGPN